MAYANKELERATRRAITRRNERYVARIRAATRCARCGGQPIEWHNPDHELPGGGFRRISQMAHLNRSIAAIKKEIAASTPYCRRCHMELDGRMAAFIANKRSRHRCSRCGRYARVIRWRLCTRCRSKK